MRALITGGGTGGHINPALAIAKIIEKNEPDSVIAFVGTPNGMENRLIPREGYSLYHIEICGFDRKNPFNNIKTLRLMLSSEKEAEKLIREFAPDVCIGTGGYVSWPLIKAAEKLGIPSVMHESNALAGAAVKATAPKLDLLLTNFDGMEKQVRCRNVVRCGNPLRSGFSDDSVSKQDAKRLLGLDGYNKSLLSFGGSLGADTVNEAVLSLMSGYSSGRKDIHHLHQVGKRNYDVMKGKYVSRGLDRESNLELVDYIYDMPVRLKAADLVVARAGAMTVSELAYLGKPAVLIPSPNVADNHQYKNAKALADRGGAVLIEEKDLAADPGLLEKTVAELIGDDEKLKALSEGISSFAVRDTDGIIYREIKKLI